ncbi:hypothetical protein V8F06_012403 [Rhypophila decipiens]
MVRFRLFLIPCCLILASALASSAAGTTGRQLLLRGALLPTSGRAPPPEPRDDSTSPAPQPAILIASCVYPVSGVYTRLQRILFYAVLAIVFIFRFHKWMLLAGSAWVAAVTVPAAVHGIALGTTQGATVDSDVVALLAILEFALLLLKNKKEEDDIWGLDSPS